MDGQRVLANLAVFCSTPTRPALAVVERDERFIGEEGGFEQKSAKVAKEVWADGWAAGLGQLGGLLFPPTRPALAVVEGDERFIGEEGGFEQKSAKVAKEIQADGWAAGLGELGGLLFSPHASGVGGC